MTLEIALIIVGTLIFLMGLFSTVICTWLFIRYFKYNHRVNSLGMTGSELARSILDAHGLQKIKVKRTGSLLFGNSYSHYFKKIRLRSFIRHETSITSIGMGAQKAALPFLTKKAIPI